MADKIELEVGCDSFRLANPPPWTASLNYASLEVSFIIIKLFNCHMNSACLYTVILKYLVKLLAARKLFIFKESRKQFVKFYIKM